MGGERDGEMGGWGGEGEGIEVENRPRTCQPSSGLGCRFLRSCRRRGYGGDLVSPFGCPLPRHRQSPCLTLGPRSLTRPAVEAQVSGGPEYRTGSGAHGVHRSDTRQQWRSCWANPAGEKAPKSSPKTSAETWVEVNKQPGLDKSSRPIQPLEPVTQEQEAPRACYTGTGGGHSAPRPCYTGTGGGPFRPSRACYTGTGGGLSDPLESVTEEQEEAIQPLSSLLHRKIFQN